MNGDNLQLDSAVAGQILDRLRPSIRPRSDWGRELPPTGILTVENDVRFLLVHHTASTNDYGSDEVVDQIQEFYDLHIGPTRGWPDVAYNFLIDRFGGIWEGRQGSLSSPIRGDATGGSQGFALLCSLIGDHVDAAPTDEAIDSLVQLLAWLGQRYDVDTTPGATVDFASRGSNLWPAGTSVATRTIAGHRDMSETTCPGRHLYALLEDDLPRRVQERRDEVYRQVGISNDTSATTADNADADDNAEPSGSDHGRTEAKITSVEIDDQALSSTTVDDDSLEQTALPAAAAVALGAVGGLIALRRRRLGWSDGGPPPVGPWSQ